MSGCRWVTTPSWLSRSLRPFCIVVAVLVQSFSHVQLFVTTWTAACQASVSFTISQSLLKLISVKSVMPSNHLVLCLPLLLLSQSFPASGSFLMNWLFASGGQSIGASASVLPVNVQGWFPLGWMGWVFLQSKELSRVFSNTTVHRTFCIALLCVTSST